jgi:hypothetical protein
VLSNFLQARVDNAENRAIARSLRVHVWWYIVSSARRRAEAAWRLDRALEDLRRVEHPSAQA